MMKGAQLKVFADPIVCPKNRPMSCCCPLHTFDTAARGAARLRCTAARIEQLEPRPLQFRANLGHDEQSASSHPTDQ